MMTGLVLVAHGNLAYEMVKAAEMIAGKLEMVEPVGIDAKDSVDAIRDTITNAIAKYAGKGVIVMTDMFGGTPSNMSLSFLEHDRVEVVTGVNLPMVLEFASEREKRSVSELAAKIRQVGQDSILVAGDYLKK